jgi:hypothetical protein
MRCLNEPLSRLANRQDQARGAFFEVPFKSVAILDEESLLATCTYIDLNPLAAGIVEVPEASPHTSIKTRIEHVNAQDRISDLKAAEQGTVAGGPSPVCPKILKSASSWQRYWSDELAVMSLINPWQAAPPAW